jgi:hypothetical protein
MDKLVLFEEATDELKESTTRRSLEPLPYINQLRNRLISTDYRDSTETRVTISGELTYHCYNHLLEIIRNLNENN